MATPHRAADAPFAVVVEAGKDDGSCACGRSRPFCDGPHGGGGPLCDGAQPIG
jgi:CDGSH-type Zn-finger protein